MRLLVGRLLWVLACLSLGTGCGTLRCHYCSGDSVEAADDSGKQELVAQPVMISVRGFGALDPNVNNPTQQRLMGLRASKMDAYRSLAERLRGIQITSNSKVEDFLARYDHLSAVVDGYVSQAKVVSQFVNDMGACETVLSVELDPKFYQLMAQSGGDLAPVQAVSATPAASAGPASTEQSPPTLSTLSVDQPQHELIENEEPVEVIPWGD